MQSSPLRQHAIRIVDYGIRAAFVCLIAVPLLFFLSMSGGLGSEPPEHGEQFFAVVLFIMLAPAYYTLMLVHMLGLSFSVLDWMLGVIVLPLFWGAAAYSVVQFCRALLRMRRQHLTK